MSIAKTPASDLSNSESTSSSFTHSGTRILPMPIYTKKVAGMARRDRTFTDPGDPGVITPEDDYLETAREDCHRI